MKLRTCFVLPVKVMILENKYFSLLYLLVNYFWKPEEVIILKGNG